MDVELADSSATNLVVTGRIPEVGVLVQPGSVVIEVTGRPVIGFSGQLPTDRTLAPGNSGPDVEQLEATLAGLGYDPGPQDKLYDTAAGAAVAAHYRTLGYEPPPPADDAKAAVPAAQAQVDDAAAAARSIRPRPPTTRRGKRRRRRRRTRPRSAKRPQP